MGLFEAGPRDPVGRQQRLEAGEVPSEEPLKCVEEQGVIVAIRAHEFPPSWIDEALTTLGMLST
jgi:hypothetical protein